MDDPAILGVILAGGKGERLGGRKAHVRLAEATLIEHVAHGMPRPLAVAGDAEAAALVSADSLSDPTGAARGPLAGVWSGLRWAAAKNALWLAIVPCDAPLLPRDLFSRLRWGAMQQGAQIAYAVSAEGAYPLCALWCVSALAPLEQAMRDGAHPSVQRFAAQVGAARVPFENADAFLNVNTPEDLKQAEMLLARHANAANRSS